MIGKQTKGKGFGGLLKYVLSKDGAEIVGKNMLGDTPEELSSEFSQSRKLRPNLKKCVYHASLSLPEGDHLVNSQWRQVADSYLEKMGFQGSQYVAVLHKDTKHQHIHIVASRVRLDGTVVSDSNDYKRSEKVLRGIEKEFGLTPVKNSIEVGRKAPTSGELRRSLREGKASTKSQLQGLIDAAILDNPSMSDFIKKMESSGVGVLPNIAKTGRVTGISFILKGERMKGSDLGRKYSWKELLNQGVSYDHDREIQAVIGAKKRATLARNVANHSSFAPNRFDASGRANRIARAFGPLAGSNFGEDRTSTGQFLRFGRSSGDLSTYLLGDVGKGGQEFEGFHKEDDTENLGGRHSRQHPHRQSSREQLLRLGLSVFGKSQKNRDVGLFRKSDFSKTENIMPERHQTDLALIINALEPFEKERIRKEKELQRQREIEERKRKLEKERELQREIEREKERRHTREKSRSIGLEIDL